MRHDTASSGHLNGHSPGLTNGIDNDTSVAGNGLTVDTPGTYTIKASAAAADASGGDGDTGTGDDDTTSTTVYPEAVTSASFKISGDHLEFVRLPRSSSVGVPVRFAIELVDAKNKQVSDPSQPDTNAALQIVLDGQNGAAGVLSEGAAALAGGSFTNGANGNDLSVNAPGTYTLEISLIDPATDEPATNIGTVTSKPFKVDGSADGASVLHALIDSGSLSNPIVIVD